MAENELGLAVSRMHKLDGSGATKAFCDVTILDSLEIKGFRVVEGKDGLFVSMPSESSKDGKWYNTVNPLKREIKDEIAKLVLEAYGG
jgi:stage V sporulation protein G